MTKTKIYRSQIRKQPSMFCALKTATQSTGTDNAVHVVSWQTVDEVNSTGNFASSTWTAPEDGWLDSMVLLSINAGSNTDDTNVWGLYKNGSPAAIHWDNWRKFSTKDGVEYMTYTIGSFAVAAGDTVDVRWYDTSYSVQILANTTSTCKWGATFFPARL